MEKLNYRRTFFIGLAFLSICAFWQMYDNIIPLILQNTFHLNETFTGMIMAADNVLAVFLHSFGQGGYASGKEDAFYTGRNGYLDCFSDDTAGGRPDRKFSCVCGLSGRTAGFHGTLPLSGSGFDAGFDT